MVRAIRSALRVFSINTFETGGNGCYATVREDERETGGSIVFLVNTLIPYDTDQAVRDAEYAACRTVLLDTCKP